MGCGCQGTGYTAPDRQKVREARIQRQEQRKQQRRVTTTISDPSNFAPKKWDPPKPSGEAA